MYYKYKIWRKLQTVICIVIFANLLHLSKSELKQQQQQQQQQNSNIEKCGNVEEEKHDLSIIFYYVSWAQDTLPILAIYEEIAQDYSKHLQFIAKDCYQLNCNCSRIYANPTGNPLHMTRWPVLEVFHGNDYMLRYTGQWKYAQMARFMEALLHPALRINNQQQLQALSSQHDAIILAHFPHINQFKLKYIQFMASAYQFLEYDAAQAFKFAISSGDHSATKLFGQRLEYPQILLLTTHNHSKNLDSYPAATEPKDAAWKLSKLIHWLQVIWLKLQPKLQGYSSPSKLATNLRAQPVLTLVTQPSLLQQFNLNNITQTSRMSLAQCSGGVAPPSSAKNCAKLPHSHIFYNNNLQQQNYFDFLNNQRLASSQDLLLQRNSRLQRLWQKCAQQGEFLPTELRVILTRFIQLQVNELLLSHESNKTLTVMLLDAQTHADFLAKQQVESAFIADNAQESIYRLEKVNTFENVLLFVQNYLMGSLPAHQLESEVGWQGRQFVQQVNGSTLLHKLQREEGESTIVLLQFAKNCVFCNLMLQTLQQISAILTLNSSFLTFLSIDMHANTLPWHLNVAHTPTLLVFPKGRFSESRIFPRNLRVNVRNVFAFIVAQMEPLEQLQVSLQMCQAGLAQLRSQNCLQFVQRLVIEHIGKHLKYWQIYDHNIEHANDERAHLLKQLNELRNINLDIQHNFSH